MTEMVITGVGTISGEGRPVPVVDDAADLPVEYAHAVTGFDAAARVGRKTAKVSHRSTLLAMAAGEAAMEAAGLLVTDEVRDRIGITVGTTTGSITGAVEFGTDSFRARPYLVDAVKAPNAIINTAAASMAIRFGLRGANSTVAAGPLAGVAALRHAQVALRAGHVDTVLAGASEEFTSASAWWAAAERSTGVPGEGAAMFVVERPEVAEAAGRRPVARLAGTLVRAVDVADEAAVRGAVAQALERAGVGPGQVDVVAVRRTGEAAVDAAQSAALTGLLSAPLFWSEAVIGDCYAAHGVLQLASLLTTAERVVLVVSVDPQGVLGAAVVRTTATP
ncbi:hypothetical protein J7I98_33150 [Streptomyces sp. ISL-98]|uniref:beta-ketoacyl synthase N-terminal-like domain-containing protein n=1 Tax=Streptomyces sp. ISL-98 TaxID=2819192 RepID=UPI001BE8EA16|nr:beta-ketoacyl synthase N-terminal-like domain-containing protein [Streptomyces sp. ISL-98]MBT2510610.1 hypothetical protein [Streptomyces sp. ISL-98]